MNIYDRLDRYKGLTKQNPKAKFREIYPDINRVMLSSLINTEKQTKIMIGDREFEPTGYITDCKNYCFETDNLDEACYLCTILNSTIIDKLLGQLRRREQKGHSDVHKKIFDVASIPDFDASDSSNIRLAEVGKQCTKKVAQWVKSGEAGTTKSIGLLRRNVREMLSEELKEIDELVKKFYKMNFKHGTNS